MENMLSEARRFMSRLAWLEITAGMMIVQTVMAINYAGDGL
jgi:ABC-type dipeptide/oligopeptide/nickel transport system permease subunit